MSSAPTPMFRTPETPAKTREESNTVATSTYHPPYNQNVSIEPGIPLDLEIQLSAACSEVNEDLTVAPDATDINAGANWRPVTRIDDSAIPKGGSFEPHSATLWEEFQKLESDFEQLSATIETLRTHHTSSLSAYAVQNQTAFDVLAECSTQQDSRILSSFEQCGVLQIRLAAVEERLRYCLSHPEFQLFRQYVEVNVNHLHHRVAAIEHRMNLAVSDYRAPNDWEYRRVDQETESEGNVETEQNLNEGLSEESVRNMIGVLRKEMDILQQHAEKRHEQGQWAFLRSSSVESEVERLSGVLSQLATRMEDLTNRFQSLEDELPVLKQDPNDKAATELPDKCYEELNDTKKPLASFTVEVESRLAQVDQNLCSQEESNKKLAAFTEEIQGGLEDIDYVNEVRDKNIQHLQSSSAELHSAWESIEGLTEQKWKQVFGSYRKVILNCEQEIKQSRNYRKQVEELLEWKKETERSRDTELVILKQRVKALQEDSQKKDVLIEELRPLVARHESLLEKGTHSCAEEVKTSMSQFMDKLKRNTDATVKFVGQTRELKNEMEKKMVQLHTLGQDSVKYCKAQIENLQTEQSEKLKDLKDSLRLHVYNRSREAEIECARLVGECKAAVTEVVDVLDTIMGLKRFRAAKV